MKNVIAGLLVLGLGAAVYAADKPAAADTTLKGEVVDMACYVSGGAKGAGHKSCAVKCVKEGSPIGILAEDGSVYLVINHAGKTLKDLKKKVAETVTVTGKVSKQNGVQGIEVSKFE